MGLGYFRSEKEVYDAETGVLLTDGTWVKSNFFVNLKIYKHIT